jgi:hypothetical protein
MLGFQRLPILKVVRNYKTPNLSIVVIFHFSFKCNFIVLKHPTWSLLQLHPVEFSKFQHFMSLLNVFVRVGPILFWNEAFLLKCRLKDNHLHCLNCASELIKRCLWRNELIKNCQSKNKYHFILVSSWSSCKPSLSHCEELRNIPQVLCFYLKAHHLYKNYTFTTIVNPYSNFHSNRLNPTQCGWTHCEDKKSYKARSHGKNKIT